MPMSIAPSAHSTGISSVRRNVMSIGISLTRANRLRSCWRKLKPGLLQQFGGLFRQAAFAGDPDPQVAHDCAGRLFIQAGNPKPARQFRLDLRPAGTRGVPAGPTDGRSSRRPRGPGAGGLPRPGSPAASMTSSASSRILAPIFSTPPRNSVVVYGMLRQLRLAVLDHRHQSVETRNLLAHGALLTRERGPRLRSQAGPTRIGEVVFGQRCSRTMTRTGRKWSSRSP